MVHLEIQKMYNFYMSKISSNQKLEIIEKYKDGMSSVKLAKEYNVSSNCILGILKKSFVETRNPRNQKEGKSITEQLLQEMVHVYENENLSFKGLAKRFDFSPSTIAKNFSKHHIKKRTREEIDASNRKYEVDEDYFNEIDTEEKAYFLGLFMSDGSNVGRAIKITLQDRDKHILEKLNSFFQPSRPLQFQKRAKPHHHDYYTLYCSNQKIKQSLEKWGCMERKTFQLKWPAFLREDLTRHFIRGYYDGDGTCSYARASIICNFEFANSLKNVISHYLSFEPSIYFDQRSPRNKTVAITSRKKMFQFLEWIYTDATIFIQRKYNHYKNMLEYTPPPKCNPDGSSLTPDQMNERRKAIMRSGSCKLNEGDNFQ